MEGVPLKVEMRPKCQAWEVWQGTSMVRGRQIEVGPRKSEKKELNLIKMPFEKALNFALAAHNICLRSQLGIIV